MYKLSLNPKNVEVIDGQYIHSTFWSEEIETNRSISDDECWILVKSNGFEVNIEFELYVDGYTETERGDYWTPSFSETIIDKVELNVKSVQIDEYSVELSKELKSKLEQLVKSII
jgi:hypothetical protein